MKFATCHPEKKHESKGLCRKCYQASRRRAGYKGGPSSTVPVKRVATCHPERQHRAKGLCQLCYMRARYHATDPAKRNSFHKKHPEQHRALMKENRSKNKERGREAASKWAKANPDKVKAKSRKSYLKNRTEILNPVRVRSANIRKYRLTDADYDLMLSKQDGVCKICKDPPGRTRLHIDHCHTTNKIRGLLCTRCNPGLGYFRDNVELLEAAIEYLRTS